MTPAPATTPSPAPAPRRRGGPLLLVVVGIAAAVAVAVVVAGPGALSRLTGGAVGGGDGGGERPEGGKPYVAPTAMDAATASLAVSPEGSTLSLVVRRVGEGEAVTARLRDSEGQGRALTVFLDRATPKSAVGLLDVTAAPGDTPDARRLTVRLPRPVDRLTVVDLRGDRRWEGFELTPAGATK